MCHTFHLTFFPDFGLFGLFWPFLTLISANLVMNKWKKAKKTHNQHISSGCILIENSKRFIQNCHQNANMFGLSFGQIWPFFVQIIGPDDFKMSKSSNQVPCYRILMLQPCFLPYITFINPPPSKLCNVHCARWNGCWVKPHIVLFFAPRLYWNTRK